MNQNVKAQFDAISKVYDTQRRMLVPCFDDFYGMPTRLMDFAASAPIRAIDLGSGTGLMAQKVLEKFPNAHMTLLDISAEMLKEARGRFGNIKNVDFKAGDFTEFSADAEYDVIVSALAIHHLPDAEKAALYKKIFAALKVGGIFVNAEQVLGETEFLRKMYLDDRIKIVHKRMPENEAEIAARRLKLDKCSTIGDQLKWLRDAGFAEVGCVYQYLDFAVIFAKK